MFLWRRSATPTDSPVFVVDALGFAAKIKACDESALVNLSDTLDRQYHRFRAKIPFGAMLVTRKRVFGTRESSTFRLNDMFVLYSEKPSADAAHRYVVAASLLFQVLLTESVIPRGGLGTGPVLRKVDSILGAGFIDAYESSEKRPAVIRDVCAIRLSHAFTGRVRPSEMTYRLLCFYQGELFVNPRAFIDPEMGSFDDERIRQLLIDGCAAEAKLNATMQFLADAEDYEAALAPDSKTRQFIAAKLEAAQLRRAD